MRLRSKLLLAQLPLALALVLVGYGSRRTIAAMDRSSQDILKDNYLSVLAAQRMRDAADTLDRMIAAQATGQRRLDPAAAAAERDRFEKELRFQESNITEAGEREMTERLRADWDRYRGRVDALLRDPAAATPARYFGDVLPALGGVEKSANEILAVNQDAMVRKSDRARRDAERMNGAMATATIAACLLGILASTILTTRLVRPLSILSQATRRVGSGDLGVRARVDGGDEIAQLARDFNAMADHLAEYRSSSLGELLQAQQSSQAAIDSLPDPVVVLTLDGGAAQRQRRGRRAARHQRREPRATRSGRSSLRVREAAQRLREHVRARARQLHAEGARGGAGDPHAPGAALLLVAREPGARRVGRGRRADHPACRT